MAARVRKHGFASSSIEHGLEAATTRFDCLPELGLLATASKDKTCRVWELRDGVYETRAVLVGHVDAVGAVALGLDAAGPFAVSASHHRTLKRWPFDVAQPRAAASVVAHDKDAHCVAVAPKGKLVASCAGDMTAKLWDPATLELRGALAGHKRGVWRCAFSATERWLATCSSDKTVKVWAVASLQCLATLQGHEDSVLALAFIGGDQLASGSADGVLKVWSPKTSTCECTVEAHVGAKCWSLAASPATANRPAALASGGGDGALRRFVDCSAGDADRARDEAEVLVEREQALRDALFKRDYGKALAEALRLDRPHTAWTALRDPPKRATGAAVDDPYDGVVAAWDLATARKCLGFAAEWNTNATRAPVAQRVRRAVVKRFGADAALGDAASRDALAAYTRRHRVRLDGLSRQTRACHFEENFTCLCLTSEGATYSPAKDKLAAKAAEIKAFFDCALKGLPFDLALRTTIKACPRCQAFFNLIMASVQAHVPAPARLCPEVPSACDHPSVMTAEGLIVLANWPPRPT
ncbi:hypothetical protein JL721_9640 [Aureococcus anophagefferens]|nr:hypothetical protein JL721_9640 [Aureococcus anophagefferens]